MRGPETRGRNARYSEYHLARLRDIARLKGNDRLSLAEIRGVLGDSTAGTGHFIAAATGSGKSHAFVQLLRDTMAKPIRHRARAVPWLRIPITPEIDFSVNGGVRPETVHLLERLADHLWAALLRPPSGKRTTKTT